MASDSWLVVRGCLTKGLIIRRGSHVASPSQDTCDFLTSLLGEASRFLTGRPRGDPYSAKKPPH